MTYKTNFTKQTIIYVTYTHIDALHQTTHTTLHYTHYITLYTLHYTTHTTLHYTLHYTIHTTLHYTHYITPRVYNIYIEESILLLYNLVESRSVKL